MEQENSDGVKAPDGQIVRRKNTVLGLVALSVFGGLILMASLNAGDEAQNDNKNTISPTATESIEPSKVPTARTTDIEIKEPTQSPTDIPIPTNAGGWASLTHQELYQASKAGGGSDVIRNKYRMSLYLEQQPTSTQAEFMTMLDDNSSENILITCNMSSSDLAKLDGNAAMLRNYPEYLIELVFEDFDDELLYYSAKCELIE